MFSQRLFFSLSIYTLALACLVLVMYPFEVKAQDVSPKTPVVPTVTKGVILANINLSNASIFNQTEDNLTVGFELENQGDSPQFDIKYGVELLKNHQGGSQTIVDGFIAEETLTLSAGQSLSKLVDYPLSGIASGTYSVWVSAKTTGGVTLGLANAGSISIAKADTVEIKAETCKLKVVGEETLFTLHQGVDVSNSETLSVDCTFINHGLNERVVIPQYETFKRTVFGDKVLLTYPEEASITLAPSEEKNISLTIPKAIEPQAYDVTISLVDTDTKAVVSNRLVAHYVLQGISATIQTVALNKSSYVAGDEIILDLFWTKSADSFVESRQGEGTSIIGNVTAYVQIVDENNLACSEKVLQILDKDMVTVKTVATADCVKPKASVLLIGPDGATLDNRSIAVTEEVPLDKSLAQESESKKDSLMTVTIIAFAIALTTILFVTSRKKRNNNTLA